MKRIFHWPSTIVVCLLATFTMQFLTAQLSHAAESSSAKNIFTEEVKDDEFLPPDVAFQLDLAGKDANNLTANFKVVPGYYLYKQRIKFVIKDAAAGKIEAIDLPLGDIKNDPNFGKQEVYHHDFAANIKLASTNNPAKNLTVQATYQGCSEKGLCYAPQTKSINVALNSAGLQANTEAGSGASSNDDKTTLALKSGNLWLVIAGFFAAGLLLSFTPCVLPMIPILSSIIVGSQSRQRMFGFYELKLPAFFEHKILNLSNKLKGGKFFGVFMMGVLSALIVSPCVAAPLAGALIYIGQSHNVLLGGVGLFALAIGMGVPLLLIGASAGSLLPKAGAWMTIVRNFFGMLMLVMASYIAWPVLPNNITQPVNTLLGFNSKQHHLPFTRVRSVADLDAAIQSAKGKTVMLDFYADWCTSCKEMEKYTFSDDKVKAALKDTVLLQADVTQNNDDDTALLKRFNLFGPPGIIFFDKTGNELAIRVIGYKNADEFTGIINKVNQ